MRQAKVLFNGIEAGRLIQHDDGSFTFRYDDSWFIDDQKPAISLTFPKSQKEYHSPYLFPFFYNMLPEGVNKEVIHTHNRIDSDDDFGLLLISTRHDSIGAINLLQIDPDVDS